jgi:hypothetical protein
MLLPSIKTAHEGMANTGLAVSMFTHSSAQLRTCVMSPSFHCLSFFFALVRLTAGKQLGHVTTLFD